MAVLVVAVRQDAERTSVADLADVFVVRELGSETWARLAIDLRVGKVTGAAVTSESRSDAWQLVHAAHRGLLVDSTEEEILSALIYHGWMRIASHEQQVMLEPPAESFPNRSVSGKKFGQLIDSDEPASTLIDPHEIRPDNELFGVFAADRLGGSSALLAMSGVGAASSRMEDRRLELRNPAALGLERVDRDSWSIVTSTVRCAVLGLASSDDAPSPKRFSEFSEPDAVSQLWETRDRDRADFWLIVELTASEADPPVWMPAGQIFEQMSFTGRQTFATTAGPALWSVLAAVRPCCFRRSASTHISARLEAIRCVRHRCGARCLKVRPKTGYGGRGSSRAGARRERRRGGDAA